MESLFHIIESFEDVTKVQEDIEKAKVISLDVETTGFDFKDDKLLLIQFRINGTTYLIQNLKVDNRLTKYILDLLNVSEKPIIAHNAKFDLKFIYEKYKVLFKNIHCSMITEYLITEAREKFASLEETVFKYLGEILDKETVKKFIDAEEITQDMLVYGANDVKFLEEIRELQISLIKEKNLQKVYKLEMELIPVVVKMESNGVMIDSKKWEGLYIDALERQEKYEKDIIEEVWKYAINHVVPNENITNALELLDFYSITHKKTKKETKRLTEITLEDVEEFEKTFKEFLNLKSHVQVKSFLQIMGAHVDSTGKKILRAIKNDFKVAELLLGYRDNNKKVTTYGIDFLENVRNDGRIYAKFNQIGTATGRFSSRKPNLQNIIAGSKYRECFIAPEGKKLITADYSQQEFRLAGELSGEPAIIEAYNKGLDMHTATASMLFHIPLEKVTKEQRNRGKTVNFAVLYGSSSYGLANTMGISNDEAEELLNKFYDGFPRLTKFQRTVEDTVWTLRYSVTPIGRRRGFNKQDTFDTSKEFYKFRGNINREGFNHIVQGGSADMIKFALILLDNNNKWGEDFKIIMTIHDEVVVEVSEEIAKEAKEFIVEVMVKAGEAFMKHIPASVDATIQNYWSK